MDDIDAESCLKDWDDLTQDYKQLEVRQYVFVRGTSKFCEVILVISQAGRGCWPDRRKVMIFTILWASRDTVTLAIVRQAQLHLSYLLGIFATQILITIQINNER